MNDPDLQALERRLRTLPPLYDVPPDLVQASLEAGVQAPDVAAGASHPRRRFRRLPPVRWSIAGAAVAAVVLVAAIITVTSGPTHPPQLRQIATLAGAGNVSGYVAVGPAQGAIEPVTVSIVNLHPAATNHYYQISFQTQGKPVPGAVFNPNPNGTAQIHLNAPKNTVWVRCWITLHTLHEHGPGTVIMIARAGQTT